MHKLIIILLVLLSASAGMAQDKEEIKAKRKALRKARPTYFIIGPQFSKIKLRDTGTSPRFYSGPRAALATSIHAEDSLKLSYFYNTTGYSFLDDNGDIETLVWSGVSVEFAFGDMWKLKATRNSKFQIGVGYNVQSFFQFRTNQRLSNAGFGLDNLISLGPSVGVFFPFERKAGWTKKIGFVNVNAKRRKYALSMRLNIPALTVSSRPEYAYLTDVINPDINSLDTYSVQLGGYLFSSETAFTYYLHNGNALRFHYRWQAMQTNDTFKLSIAQHAYGINFMIRLNKINRDERY
ncbi:MAG: hypothetical protein RIC80_05585 [Cyclobacteriaceae bacterium]